VTKFPNGFGHAAPLGQRKHPVAFKKLPIRHPVGIVQIDIPEIRVSVVTPFEGCCPLGQVAGCDVPPVQAYPGGHGKHPPFCRKVPGLQVVITTQVDAPEVLFGQVPNGQTVGNAEPPVQIVFSGQDMQ